MTKPLCFIIMPFGKKKDPASNREIDFDIIYEQYIKPSVEKAGMEPIRADEEKIGGVIHKPMYERLILCEYAVADLTTANANVFYELGVRHVVRPSTTVTIFAKGFNLPFDINFLRSKPYDLNEKSELSNLEDNKNSLVADLKRLKKDKQTDSPIYQLLAGIKFKNNLTIEQTEAFKNQVDEINKKKIRLMKILNSKDRTENKIKLVSKIKEEIGTINEDEIGISIKIIFAYRTLEAYGDIVEFIEKMPQYIQNITVIQEQYGLSLNRIGRSQESIEVLENLIKRNGPSSETLGILARIYKDRYVYHKKNNETLQAISSLDKAIETYLLGFETDTRDYFPGVNAVTLMNIKGDERVHNLAPAVLYATESKIKTKTPDYWDYATVIELTVISNDTKRALEYLGKVMTLPFNPFERKSTIGNLKLIIDKKKNDGEDIKWIKEIAEELEKE